MYCNSFLALLIMHINHKDTQVITESSLSLYTYFLEFLLSIPWVVSPLSWTTENIVIVDIVSTAFGISAGCIWAQPREHDYVHYYMSLLSEVY